MQSNAIGQELPCLLFAPEYSFIFPRLRVRREKSEREVEMIGKEIGVVRSTHSSAGAHLIIVILSHNRENSRSQL